MAGTAELLELLGRFLGGAPLGETVKAEAEHLRAMAPGASVWAGPAADGPAGATEGGERLATSTCLAVIWRRHLK